MVEDNHNTVLLVDGASYLYRAFHATSHVNMRTSTNYPTGAIKVIVSMLQQLMNQYAKSRIIVVFDAKGKNFRHQLYSDYKANRKKMPEDLVLQIEPIYQIIDALGLPLISVANVEADDVIGTLAYQAKALGFNTMIVSGDKDLVQLIDDKIIVMDTMKQITYTKINVRDYFGIDPELMVDFLALKGDSSDNIPGMPGVGDKTAQLLLNHFGDLVAIKKNLNQIESLNFRGSKQFGAKFLQYESQVMLSRELATIKKDIDLPQSIDKLVKTSMNQQKLLELLETYELVSLIKSFQLNANQNDHESISKVHLPTKNYQVIFSAELLKLWIDKIIKYKRVAIDTETTGLDYMNDHLVGISIACQAHEAAYIPLFHSQFNQNVVDQLDAAWVIEQLKPIILDPTILKIGQNIKFDAHILRKWGITDWGKNCFDTMIASHIINSTASRHDLDHLAAFYLHYKTITFENIAGKGAKQLSFDKIDIDIATQYACEDADVTLQLYEKFKTDLDDNKRQRDIFFNIEMPLIQLLTDIEHDGVMIDGEMLKTQSQTILKTMTVIEKNIYEAVGGAFNLNSPKQLQEILFEKEGLPIIKKTPKGIPSTSEEVLQQLSHEYPLVDLILQFRQLSKLKSTYTDKLPNMIDPLTGRIHTSYHQVGTATGRLSSSDPNLQNIPIKNEAGKQVRKAFIANKKYKIIAADYSQIELRIMAHFSQDTNLVEAFMKNLDVHSTTAADLFSVEVAQVTKDQRRKAKAINFGLIYGMSAFGLAKQLGISRFEAQQYIELYFKKYPKIKDYMDSIRLFAQENGYVETLLGRRLYLPQLQIKNAHNAYKAALRTAINAPLQGTAADIIKIAMLQVNDWLKANASEAKMIMQVHDELVFEVPEHEVDQVIVGVVQNMENALALSVPLRVDAHIGLNWEEAHN